MKVHITNLYGQSPLSVALMAQNMVADIAKKLDIKEIGIYSFNADGESVENLAIRFDGMNAAVGNGDVIIFQAPSWNGTHFDHEYLKRLRIYSGIKIVIFIHDIPPLMFSSNFYLMEKTIEMYNMADLIIAPSQKMLDLLYQHGLRVTNTLLQNMWDHKTDIWLENLPFTVLSTSQEIRNVSTLLTTGSLQHRSISLRQNITQPNPTMWPTKVGNTVSAYSKN